MTADGFARLLRRLLGGASVPASSVSRRGRLRLAPLFETGAIREERSGAGRRIVVIRDDAVRAFASRHYPAGLQPELIGIPPRSRAVLTQRNAKRAARTDAEPILLRSVNACVALVGAHRLDVTEWTRRAGVAAVRVSDSHDDVRLQGRVAVVENLEFFLHVERTRIPFDVALHSPYGRLSARALEWLGSEGMRGCSYLHCGDYDPVGLDEYLRLGRAAPGRTQLYVPDDLPALLRTFGKAALVSENQAILARLRRERDPTVRAVVDLIDEFGVGLEQEVLLAPR